MAHLVWFQERESNAADNASPSTSVAVSDDWMTRVDEELKHGHASAVGAPLMAEVRRRWGVGLSPSNSHDWWVERLGWAVQGHVVVLL